MSFQDIILTVAVVVAFSFALSIRDIRIKRSSWAGFLEDKFFLEGDDGSQDKYTLIFKTDLGRRVKIDADKGTYEFFNKGDRVIKNKGSYFPEKQNCDICK